jgi:P2 family phage contractile tail tube protein
MAFPSKLKNFNLFNDGNNYQGQVAEIDLPKLTRKTEDWRGAGMGGAVKVDMGQEAMQMEWTCGGMMRGVLAQWGVTKHNAVLLRFAGAYQAEDSDTPDAVEVVVRGRHSEIDMGKAKAGDETSMKITTQLTYYNRHDRHDRKSRRRRSPGGRPYCHRPVIDPAAAPPRQPGGIPFL